MLQVLLEFVSMTDFVKITILEHDSIEGSGEQLSANMHLLALVGSRTPAKATSLSADGKMLVKEGSKPREGPLWRLNVSSCFALSF